MAFAFFEIRGLFCLDSVLENLKLHTRWCELFFFVGKYLSLWKSKGIFAVPSCQEMRA